MNKSRVARGKEPITRRGGYAPHFFHTWMVREGGTGKVLGSARNVKEATKIAQEAIRQGRNVKIEPKQFEFGNEGMQQITLADQDYFKFQKSLKDNFSMTVEEAQQLTQTLAKRKGRSRHFGPAIERKGAPNFEQNMDFAFKHYFNMASRYIALDKFKHQATNKFIGRFGDFDKPQKMNTIAKYTKNYINDINGVPRQTEVVLDNLFKGDTKFAKFMSDRLGERPASQMAAFTTKAVAAAKLGFLNVSAAMVNGSQLMMGNAILGSRWMADGMTRAARLDAIKIKNFFRKGKKGNKDLAILEKLGVEFQEGLEGAHNLSGKMGKMFDAGLLPFTMVEYRLRAAVSLGAYYKAMAGKVKGVPGGNKPMAMEYARQANTRSNFDYTIADAPDFIRSGGPISQVAFQFKKFPVKALEFMTELKGAENPRFWIPFVTVAGLYGFPGFEALNRAVKSVYGFDIELETKDHWMRWAGDDPEKQALANTIMRGVMSNKELGGVDLSRRIGGGDFIPTRPSDLAGPAVSSVWRAGQMAAQAEWVEAMRQMVTTPGNIALAIQNDGEIYNVWDRNRMRIKLTPEEQIKKGFGLTGTRESTERDIIRIMRYKEGKLKREQKDAIDKFIKDGTPIPPDLGVTSEQLFNEMKKKKMTPTQRAFDNLGRKGKARQTPLLEFTKPR